MKRLILATALLAVGAPVSASETLAGPFSAEILRVIDGDTVEARVHVWLGMDITTRVRLRNIDAPEMHGDCPEAAAAAMLEAGHAVRWPRKKGETSCPD